MPRSNEELEGDVAEAATAGFRGRLIARGQARAMIWRGGVLPPGAPEFAPSLTHDLQCYGYALLHIAFRLSDQDGSRDSIRRAFEQAAIALEATITNGDPADENRSFHRVMASAAYHLGRFSARAYSVLASLDNSNYSLPERAIARLILRDLTGLREFVLAERTQGNGRDSAIAAYLQEGLAISNEDVPTVDSDGQSFVIEALDRAVTDAFLAALAIFALALERGERDLLQQAVERLRLGLDVCASANLLPQWWIYKIAIQLISDLWASSFHEVLPITPPDGDDEAWASLREMFIAVLHSRERSEVELWPSQISAGRRAADQRDDLVVSLPTSAGKTRVAEICILRCLAAGKRVAFVTPLRALSAQTEVTLQRTFVPLGKTISTLYGSIGVSGFDADAIRSRNIVVATPEKLDFAIRNDPTLIDDVGLLVFDEGHMIGIGEREVRYEVQIQRLLQRADADQRRIVCLSAILPDGDQLEDFTAWLRRDAHGGAIRSDWRPTGLHFGELIWGNGEGRLNLRVDDERPFIRRFLTASVPPIGRRTTPFPKDLGELCLATAWRFVRDGQSVLIFCPVRAHVEPFADRIVDLHERGALASLLAEDPAVLQTALTLGEEWLGVDHPILKCLKLGVAIHHGTLPTAYRKEVERLLRSGILKVTISSPTLAQGLNLSATTIIVHSLTRNRVRIEASEFKNVIGRAGRAYIDVRGLVIYPIFDRHAHRLGEWQGLIDDTRTREMESGLVRLVASLLQRMNRSLGPPQDINQLVEYVVNNAEAWDFPQVAGESEERQENERREWLSHVAILDTAILSLLGNVDIPEDEIPARLDEVLGSSLWQRRLARQPEHIRDALKAGLAGRAKHIWRASTPRQRKGYFLAGIGLDAGHAFDNVAPNLNALLVDANGAILGGNAETAIASIISIAEIVFQIPPFAPDHMPVNWKEILRQWLLGETMVTTLGEDPGGGFHFVEDALVYRLSWALETVRVRAVANEEGVGDPSVRLEDMETGLAAPAVEAGSLDRSVVVLIQAGFATRVGASNAVRTTGGAFSDAAGLRQWLSSEDVGALSLTDNWPTPETAIMWKTFRESFGAGASQVWTRQTADVPVTWLENAPGAGEPLRVYTPPGTADSVILTPDGQVRGTLDIPLNRHRKGLVRATSLADETSVQISYIGPNDLWQH